MCSPTPTQQYEAGGSVCRGYSVPHTAYGITFQNGLPPTADRPAATTGHRHRHQRWTGVQADPHGVRRLLPAGAEGAGVPLPNTGRPVHQHHLRAAEGPQVSVRRLCIVVVLGLDMSLTLATAGRWCACCCPRPSAARCRAPSPRCWPLPTTTTRTLRRRCTGIS